MPSSSRSPISPFWRRVEATTIALFPGRPCTDGAGFFAVARRDGAAASTAADHPHALNVAACRWNPKQSARWDE